MDAYLRIARDSIDQATCLAKRGDLSEVLSLAFNSIIHLTLDLANRTPEELLDEILVDFDRPSTTKLLITPDRALVLEIIRSAPGPIFDLDPDGTRRSENASLTQSKWYVPLEQVGSVQINMVERILRLSDFAYIVDPEPRFQANGEIEMPGGTVICIRHEEKQVENASQRDHLEGHSLDGFVRNLLEDKNLLAFPGRK